MTRLLITGGAGFISSHIIAHFLAKTDWEIVVLDKFTYASHGLARLKDIGAYDNSRVKIHVVDIARTMSDCLIDEIGPVDYIFHMAAGTHVDNSIRSPRDFVVDNVTGTLEMLEYARRLPSLKMFLYFSTDEVFGPAKVGQSFKEWDRYNSRNPYSATKAGGEELALAWCNTYKVPVVITHTMNVIGERQHIEKFVPKVVRAALTGETLKIHTDPKTGISGSRVYLHGNDVADALRFLIHQAVIGDKYNIAGSTEVSNLEVAQLVQNILGRTLYIDMVEPKDVRPGFDLRYDVDGSKMREMGWAAPATFDENIRRTVLWYARPENREWLHL
jgi:dTDP-glucose 4,6-dehydratase